MIFRSKTLLNMDRNTKITLFSDVIFEEKRLQEEVAFVAGGGARDQLIYPHLNR